MNLQNTFLGVIGQVGQFARGVIGKQASSGIGDVAKQLGEQKEQNAAFSKQISEQVGSLDSRLDYLTDDMQANMEGNVNMLDQQMGELAKQQAEMKKQLAKLQRANKKMGGKK